MRCLTGLKTLRNGWLRLKASSQKRELDLETKELLDAGCLMNKTKMTAMDNKIPLAPVENK